MSTNSGCETILVTRTNGRAPWIFKRNAEGRFICKKQKWTYHLIIEPADRAARIGKLVWIARELEGGELITVEDTIGAATVQFTFGVYKFQ